MPLTNFDTDPEAIKPAWQNNNLSQGISDVDFLTGEQWGAWNARMVVGFMGIGFGDTPVGNRIEIIDMADDGPSVNDVTEMPLPMDPARFRVLTQGPDDKLYAVVEGNVYRISPE